MKKRAVIYARFSSHNQTEQSIEGQLRECHEFARKNKYIVLEEYIDRAISGTTDKRPDFLRMIEDGKSKNFDYVIVYQLDRFARNRYDSALNTLILLNNGVKVVSATEIYNRPENNLDDDTNDSGTTIYKQDVELTENDIRKHSRCLCYSCVPKKNCRLTFRSNDNCLAGSPLSNPNTKIYVGSRWVRLRIFYN